MNADPVNAENLEPPVNIGTSPMGWDAYLEAAAHNLLELHATLDVLRGKIEAAGVLYGEPLYRELDITAQAANDRRSDAFSAVLTGRRMAEDELARRTDVIREYAEDQRRSMDAYERLSDRIGELEELATQPAVADPPTDRAATILDHITEYLTLVTLTHDEAAWLRTAIPAHLNDAPAPAPQDVIPATPVPTPEPHAEAAGRWANLAGLTGEPINENLALALVAVRAERGLPLEPQDIIVARAWLAWARAGFHGDPPPDGPQ